jgi:hypothetical protein
MQPGDDRGCVQLNAQAMVRPRRRRQLVATLCRLPPPRPARGSDQLPQTPAEKPLREPDQDVRQAGVAQHASRERSEDLNTWITTGCDPR